MNGQTGASITGFTAPRSGSPAGRPPCRLAALRAPRDMTTRLLIYLFTESLGDCLANGRLQLRVGVEFRDKGSDYLYVRDFGAA